MSSEPFDEELDKDTVVPHDAVYGAVQITPIETVEDFKRRLAAVDADELAFLLTQMKPDEPSGEQPPSTG